MTVFQTTYMRQLSVNQKKMLKKLLRTLFVKVLLINEHKNA